MPKLFFNLNQVLHSSISPNFTDSNGSTRFLNSLIPTGFPSKEGKLSLQGLTSGWLH